MEELTSGNRFTGIATTHQPYWGFEDLFHSAGKKLKNCFFALADSKILDKKEYFRYEKFLILSHLNFEKFLEAIKLDYILVDFDARTGHNHGTKFRIRRDKLPFLYSDIQEF